MARQPAPPRFLPAFLLPLASLLFASALPALAADLVLRDARIVTLDPTLPEAEALAIDEGRIVAVGSNREIEALITPRTLVYSLPGRTVLPGFQDAHNHLVWSATELEDISLYDATDLDSLMATLRDAAERAAGDETAGGQTWLRGGGWDLSAFPDDTLDRALLDEIFPDRPVYLTSADAHSAWVNSRALEIAGIDAASPDPAGGRIERDAEGAPTGILRESATELVAGLLPDYPDEQVDRGLEAALAEANSYGITAIIDPKAEDWMLAGYARALARDSLTVRVRAAVEIKPGHGQSGLEAALEARERYQDPMLTVNAVKLFADGVLESKTAALLQPYVDEESRGELLFPTEEMNEIVAAADKLGFQLHVHAIGDAAIRQTLDAFEAARAANGARDSRHQICHLELIDPADIGRFAELGAFANFQPLWAYPDSYITDLTEPVIGPDRSEWLYPIGAVAATGATVVAGSDWSVSSMNPLEAIEVGVTRQDPEDPSGRVLTAQHKAELMTLVRAYTVEAARALFMEEQTGSVTPGKLADIVVLDRDLFAIPPAEISEAQVLLTLLGGQPVYASVELPEPARD